MPQSEPGAMMPSLGPCFSCSSGRGLTRHPSGGPEPRNASPSRSLGMNLSVILRLRLEDPAVPQISARSSKKPAPSTLLRRIPLRVVVTKVQSARQTRKVTAPARLSKSAAIRGRGSASKGTLDKEVARKWKHGTRRPYQNLYRVMGNCESVECPSGRVASGPPSERPNFGNILPNLFVHQWLGA